MKEKNLPKDLMEVLQYCKLSTLPKKDNGEYVWLKAVARIRKRDGSRAFAILAKDEEGNPKVVKDFGSISPIASIDDVYPYLIMDSKMLPEFTTKTREERIKWLNRNGVNNDMSLCTIKELEKKILLVCMAKAIKENSKNQ